MNIVCMNLYNEMNRRSLSIATLSNLIGVSEVVFMDKLRGLLPWDLSEALKICCFLEISDVKYLFLQLDTNR